MCRLMGAVAAEHTTVGDLLAGQIRPFLATAREHGDGWGLAALADDGSLQRIRGQGRADHSARLFRALASWRTTAAVLHLRMATPGMAVRAGNTHPFGAPHLAFAHNGAFEPANVLDPLIGPVLLAEAEGTTDSERFHLAVRARMAEGLSAGQALEAAAADIRRLADTFVSLNALLLTSGGLFAYADHDPESEVSVRRGTGYFDLRCLRAARTDRVVISSDGPWTRSGPWQRLPKRQAWRVLPTNGLADEGAGKGHTSESRQQTASAAFD